MKERYIACFGEDFKNSYLKYLDKIRKYVSKCNNLFTINVYDLEIEDLVKKCNDKDYLNDKNISFIHNGIEIIVPLEDFWSDIKNYIPKSVTRLELPSSFIENDIMFFSDFLNLETLVVSDHGRLSTDIIKLIEENTNIKTIYSRGVIWGVYDFANEEGFTALDTPYKCCVYKDILYRNINEPDIDINNYFKPSIAISSYDLYVSAIERLYTIADDRLKDKVTVETMDCYYEIEFDKEKKSYNIKVKSDDVSYVSRIVNYMSNKGISVDSVLWKMKDKNYYDKDLSCLEDISKKVELSINYGDYLDASYEEFRGLLESVKWYRKIISDSNLSSVEKVMFAFDILKTFRYNESEEDKEDSRYAHRIIETGNIVCLGYSNLLVQILNYLDNNIRVIEFGLDCYDENKSFLGGHSRCLVKLDDDKYNIHGIFALDATWDSDKSHVISSDFASDYTALDLYRYFLVSRHVSTKNTHSK